MEIEGQRILVVGMAASGMAAARFLRKRGARVVVSEVRAAVELRAQIAELLDAGIAVETGGHRERSFLDADLIITSPGVPADLPLLRRARAQQTPVLGELELASRYLRGMLVAITGANGKTTTTALTGHILTACGRKVQVGGNIGTPLISLVESSTAETVNVVEASSFQLETTETFHPHVAAVLNLSPDHLDRHGSMEAYAAAKQRIFRNQTKEDFAVLNPNDVWCRQFAAVLNSQAVWFAAFPLESQTGAEVREGQIVWTRGGKQHPIMPVKEVPLPGAHNLENVLAAVAMACLVAGPEAAPAIRQAVGSFKAVEHRLEYVATINGVAYYNDSKATNVDATMKALASFEKGIWIILGGKDKGSDYTTLEPLLRERARGVLLIGAATEKIAAQLAPLSAAVPLTRCGTLDQAIATASAQAQAGDTILLAPACASFDQFENYGHRGRMFKELVRKLGARGQGPGAGGHQSSVISHQ
ncbi:MAG: UDP-N-acetylmuramoyl-L-alanine--D-glutamate ligase [Acidobacteria bacterium]|nr:MAG: UDP-N-acetylmuramoyl-L-alanine--D-glutamate ligase [Acidobacteriota bacterium]